MSTKDELNEETQELLDALDSLPPPTDAEIDALEKWMAIEMDTLIKMEEEVGIAGVMTILTKIIASVVIAKGVPLDRFQMGMTLAFLAAKQRHDEDILTPSQSVH
jgi:hypothetical protein